VERPRRAGEHRLELRTSLMLRRIDDRSPIHRRSAVQKFITSAGEARLVVEFLPIYAPDLNPVEWLWKHLKGVELCNQPCLDLEELHSELHLAVDRVRRNLSLIASFFEGAGLPLTEL